MLRRPIIALALAAVLVSGGAVAAYGQGPFGARSGAADLETTSQGADAGITTSSPFTGVWIGHDPAPPVSDGSTVHLDISGGARARIVFSDEFGTVCVDSGASDTFFTSVLRGRADGNVLNARFTKASCGTTTIDFLIGATATYVFDDQGTPRLGDDTLWDGFVLWRRDH